MSSVLPIRFVVALVALTSLMVQALTPSASGADAAAGKLVIVTAEYGDLDSDKTLDVTAKVAAMVKDNSLFVEATDAALGTAPGDGPKKLKVGYNIDGLYRSKTVDKGQALDISTHLVILKAVYGDLAGGHTADVTDQVSEMVRKNKLSVEATNDNFGDPASGTPKHMRVDYSIDGVTKSVTVDENQTINIP